MRAADLPVRTALPDLRSALRAEGGAILCAPPGTGKTTLVPLALAGLTGDTPARTVLVAEPRRIAARAAARRMAWMLGERPGERIGFTVRGERRAGPRTVVEVVTTGVLLQRLQRDPELPGVGTVLLDECHERHLDADTSAAFLLDVRATLRPDLHLVAASATTDAEGWAALLDAPVVAARAASYPVETVWAPPPRPVRPPHGMRVDPALLEHVAATVRRALRERAGDVLCFLPGVGEAGRVARLLGDVSAEVLQVHGRAPAEVQDAVLAGGDGTRRRVVLATAVAESSLTVPGVRVVVDAGLAREPRVDHARGLAALTTVRASQAAARQRAGRAGREAPGTAYRCWPEGEDARLPRFPSPEITVADLTAFALQAACWGDPDARGLALLDAPPAGALAAAREALRAVGAVDAAGRATPRGVRMSRLGLHPRLARALLDASPALGARRAAEVVALLSEEPPREYGDDLSGAWRTARRGGDAYAGRWRAEARRLEGALRAASPGTADHPRTPAQGYAAGPTGGRAPGPTAERGERAPETPPAPAQEPAPAPQSADAPGTPHAPRTPALGYVAPPTSPLAAGAARSYDAAAGLVAALAFPERVAKRRAGGGYLMAGGTAAEPGEALRGSEWLAVAVADRPVGSAAARVRLAAPVDEATARDAAAALFAEEDEVRWDPARGSVTARRVARLGAIELSARTLARPDPALVRRAQLDALRREGLALLPWPPRAAALRQRLAFLHRAIGDPWPDVSDEALLERAAEWLGDGRHSLSRTDTTALLTGLLPWSGGEAARLDDLAPERIEVPSGSRVRVDYTDPARPVLAVKLQELFGLQDTPRIADGRVPLLVHLLSPAGRPAAVTSDLKSFWADGYRAVRAELRGRYPRHPWPEDPATARPTRRTNRARPT